jgi:hypothetical protein
MSGFFDTFLLAAVIIVALLTAFDWLVGPDARKRMREAVGDFWTALQYSTIDSLFVAIVVQGAQFLKRIYGDGRVSVRLVLAAALTNMFLPVLLIAAVYPRTIPLFVAPEMLPFLLMGLTFVALLGWLPFKWMMRALLERTNDSMTWFETLKLLLWLSMRVVVYSLMFPWTLVALWALFIWFAPADITATTWVITAVVTILLGWRAVANDIRSVRRELSTGANIHSIVAFVTGRVIIRFVQ